jgi:hypothetical protein
MLAVDRLTWSEVPLMQLLTLNRFGGRTIDPSTAVLSSFTQAGNSALVASSARTRVYGTVLATRKNHARMPIPLTAADLAADRGSGVVVLLAFGHVEGRILTETRCLARDPRSRRAFAAYWAVIRPASGLLRRLWLAALRERAQWTLTTSPVTGDIT